MMRRYVLVIGLCLAVLLAGCDRSSELSAAKKPTIVVSGSGAYLEVLNLLAASYPQRESVRFVFFDQTHSSGGVRGVRSGEFDLGGVSRSLDASEQAAALEYHCLSTDAMAIAVHPSVEMTGITTPQLRSIYSGKITNWRQLGGPDLPVVVLDRNEEESAKAAFRKYILGDTQVTTCTSPLLFEDDMLAGIAETPGAVGYVSSGFARCRVAPVRSLTLDGVAPTMDAVQGGYRFVRPLGFVMRRESAPPVRAFARWAVGEDAAELLREKGYAAALPAR